MEKCDILQIPREQNGEADYLAKIASDLRSHGEERVQMLEYREGRESASIEVDEGDWRFPIIQTLTNKQAPVMAKRRYV